MAITLLDQNTINKIAAGEVIERPSSVVKELVENAIDAGASAVTVEIKEGGISFIRVTDNGSGIKRDDIELAFKRHATSKIKSVEDLLTVSSLGFRGEALASIASVAQVELITKTTDSLNGYRYVIEGGENISLEEVGAPDGTTFIVRNLFFNTPVRRKFLKSATTEGGYIGSLIEYLALSHPDISFRFISNNNNKLHTSGNMNLKDIIYNVYGRDITSNLYDINLKAQDIEVGGFIGKPSICRGNRTYENYYINGRYIKSSVITKAIEDAYKGYMMPHNYPFCVLHFNIEPAVIDVNVHPTKMEIRFSNNEYIYNFVYNAILSTLKNAELIMKVSVENRMPKPLPVKEDVVKPVMEKRLPEPFEEKREALLVKEKAVKYNNEIKENQKPLQMTLFDNKLLSEESRSNYRIIGQLFETYWLIEFEDKFYIMDQHAAHEKILFEKTMRRLKEKSIDSQMLLPPVILTLNMQEENVLKNNMRLFSNLGYEIEEFGGNEYKVTGVPAGLPTLDYKQLLIDVLDGLVAEKNTKDPDYITEKVASMSCKAAIKGNSRISFNEAREIMDELMKADNPYNCPHGRPTLILMTKYDIEKKFKRIV